MTSKIVPISLAQRSKLEEPKDFSPVGCQACRNPNGIGIDITMAFQPIVDLSTGTIFGYEALVRGVNGEGAGEVLAHVTDETRYTFDQTCRVTAIDLAAKLGLKGKLSINFLPNAVYRPETCIRATLQAAKEKNFPIDQIMFEVTEGEQVADHEHLKNIFIEYKKQGFTTAIDDFGAGHSGLNLLSNFQPDIVKIDMMLTRGIDKDHVRRAIVNSIASLCKVLNIKIVAEGIETPEEALTLRALGIDLFQGYLFAKPKVASLPEVDFEAHKVQGLIG